MTVGIARRGLLHTIAPLLAAGILVGCTTQGSRPCSSFDHPDGARWSGGDAPGDTRSFVDAAGRNVAFTLDSVTPNEPREVSSATEDDDEVTCLKSVEYRYVAAALDTAWRLDFVQREARRDDPLDGQIVRLALQVENPPGRDVPGHDFAFVLSDLDSTFNNVDSDTVTGRYLARVNVGGREYTDVLEQTLIDRAAGFDREDVDAPARWVRVLLAPGTGLVQYELLDGTVYTLAPR